METWGAEAYGGITFMCLFFSEDLKVLACFKRYCPLWVRCPYIVVAVMIIVCGGGFTYGFRKKMFACLAAVLGEKTFINNQVEFQKR